MTAGYSLEYALGKIGPGRYRTCKSGCVLGLHRLAKSLNHHHFPPPKDTSNIINGLIQNSRTCKHCSAYHGTGPCTSTNLPAVSRGRRVFKNNHLSKVQAQAACSAPLAAYSSEGIMQGSSCMWPLLQDRLMLMLQQQQQPAHCHGPSKAPHPATAVLDPWSACQKWHACAVLAAFMPPPHITSPQHSRVLLLRQPPVKGQYLKASFLATDAGLCRHVKASMPWPLQWMCDARPALQYCWHINLPQIHKRKIARDVSFWQEELCQAAMHVHASPY